MYLQPEDLLKILLSILAGGLIGIEREFRDKAAGFRTLIFICLGSALFTIFSVKLAGDEDPTRIAANIVSGVGFLGAGVILRDGGGRVVGLTTAATIWLTAALGMGLGGGEYALAGVGILAALIILWLFPRLEYWVNQKREERTYEVICLPRPGKLAELEQTFRKSGLHIRAHRHAKGGSDTTCTWYASGSSAAHKRLLEQLFADAEVKEFRT